MQSLALLLMGAPADGAMLLPALTLSLTVRYCETLSLNLLSLHVCTYMYSVCV